LFNSQHRSHKPEPPTLSPTQDSFAIGLAAPPIPRLHAHFAFRLAIQSCTGSSPSPRLPKRNGGLPASQHESQTRSTPVPVVAAQTLCYPRPRTSPTAVSPLLQPPTRDCRRPPTCEAILSPSPGFRPVSRRSTPPSRLPTTHPRPRARPARPRPTSPLTRTVAQTYSSPVRQCYPPATRDLSRHSLPPPIEPSWAAPQTSTSAPLRP
jgi:hypothetical protein